MQKEILVSYEGDEPRVAVLEDARLVEVYIERANTQRLVGNIYKGRVQKVLPGMQAAFVDIGIERNSFLYVDDARPLAPGQLDEDDPEESEGPEGALGTVGQAPSGAVDGAPGGGGAPGRAAPASPPIQDLLHQGQEIVVQLSKEPTGSKGARVTCHVSLPGRYLVLMPSVNHVGVSRRIRDEQERDRLRALARRIGRGRMGMIVRTVADGCSEEDLRADWLELRGTWRQVSQRARRARAPALLYHDLGLVPRIIRDRLGEDVARVVVDRPDEYERLREAVAEVAPSFRDRVELWPESGAALFAARGVDAEIARALERRVWLKSGGYLVIDQVEALTVIDVNTGRFVGRSSLADTVFQTNMEAAAEIARQIRLRDIGGIIVVDFIDMEVPEHRRRVVQALTDACSPDRSQPTVLGLTHLGLVEMTRKKARQSLRDLLTRPCADCDGRGRVPTEDTVSRRVRREIRRILRTAGSEAIFVEVCPAVAALLIGPGGKALRDLEKETGRGVFVRGNAQCGLDEMRVRALGTAREVEEQARPVRVGEVIDLRVEEPHVSNAEDGIARLDGYVVDIEGGARRVGERVRVEITRAFRTYARARLL